MNKRCIIIKLIEMEFPVDWDVDEYKVEHESDEQWDMRRSFMVRWKNNFPEDRLVCLARVFTNIEFLNCRYPAEVMKLVAELSKEVAADYRTQKKTKLQRTFVSASDAAEDRAKGVKRPANEPATSSSTKQDPKGPKLFVAAQASDKDHMNQQKTGERPSFQSQDDDERPSFQSARPSFQSGKPSFQSERPSFQSERPLFQSEKPSFQSDRPSFQSDRPSFQSEKPYYQSETPTSQYERPSIQSGMSNFQNDRHSFQNQRPTFQNNGPPFQRGMNNDNSRWGDRNDRGQRNFQGRNEGNERGGNRRDRNQNNQRQPAVDDSIITSKYGRLVLFERPGTTTNNLYGSCQQSKATITAECEQLGDQSSCIVVINGIEVTSAVGPSKKEAKEAAYNAAWSLLKQHCYTLQVLATHVSQEDKKISINDVGTGDTSLEDGLDTRVDSAVATRIMKMMGWSGGGLGSTGDGIHEPIAPHLKQIRRAGLGSSEGDGYSPNTMEALRSTIEQFSREGDSNYDLVFANDFTKKERAEMHKIALRAGLKSKSYGKDDDRYMVISKHLQLSALVRSLQAAGGSNDKYKLIPPK